MSETRFHTHIEPQAKLSIHFLSSLLCVFWPEREISILGITLPQMVHVVVRETD
jgi:hypothetical protein